MRIAMLGSGFIGRFYAESLHGQRSRDRIVSIYSRKEESAKKFASDYGCPHWTIAMEEAVAHPDVDVVVFPCRTISMKQQLCYAVNIRKQ
jgi:predicted dehydrogenase